MSLTFAHSGDLKCGCNKEASDLNYRTVVNLSERDEIWTRRPFFRSRPSKYLVLASGLIAAATLLMPYTPLGAVLNFIPLPPLFLILLLAIVVLYIVSAEVTKRVFYRKAGLGGPLDKR